MATVPCPADARTASDPLARRALRWLIFPVSYLLAAIALWFSLQAGYSAAWSTLAISAVVAVVLLAAEYVQPYARRWQRSHGDVPTDLAHLTLSTFLMPALFKLLRAGLLAGAVWLTAWWGAALWPTSWPILAQFVVAMLIAEFLPYWWHRLAHEHDLLWRFHATHHCSERLYWLNACRFHPVDAFAHYALEVTPLLLLGCPADILALYTLSAAVIGMFQHANVDLRIGPLNYVFSLSELHRWHHSKKLDEAFANYGANLIVWDIVFGTRHLPADRDLSPSQVGLGSMSIFPKTYWGQFLTPFRWAKLKRLQPPRKSASAERDVSEQSKGA